MEHRVEVETSLGPVWLWGRGDTGAPILLLITGVFAIFDTLGRTADAIEGVDVWRTHLPGNHCPELSATSVDAFAAAISQALQTRFPDRPTVVLGISVGALVAMGLRSPHIRRLLLLEPPLLTEGLWPLRNLADHPPPGSEAMLWTVLGIRPDAVEPRDYRALLDQLRIPALVLVGQEPLLPERKSEIMPSLISPATRDALEASRLVEIVEAPGAGHNLPNLAKPLLAQAALWSCRQAFGPSVRFAGAVDGADSGA